MRRNIIYNYADLYKFAFNNKIDHMDLYAVFDRALDVNRWPSHKPDATLHEIIRDGVMRDLETAQIIEDTLGLASEEMVHVYRCYFDKEMTNG